jgi:hypothetical protein
VTRTTLDAIANARTRAPETRDYLDVALVELADAWTALLDARAQPRCPHLREPELCDECLESPL